MPTGRKLGKKCHARLVNDYSNFMVSGRLSYSLRNDKRLKSLLVIKRPHKILKQNIIILKPLHRFFCAVQGFSKTNAITVSQLEGLNNVKRFIRKPSSS